MPTKLKNILIYSFTLAAVAYLLWVVYGQIEPPIVNGKQLTKFQFIGQLAKSANYSFLLISALCAVIAHLVRAERWRLVLTPMGHQVSLWHSFLAVMVSYFINLVIPRGGEVSRSVSLNKMTRKVPVDAALGTIVAERIIDLIFLLLCIGTVFIFQFDTLMNFLTHSPQDSNLPMEEKGFSKLLLLAIIGGGLLLIVLIFYIIKREVFLTLKGKVIEFLKGLKVGLFAVFKLKKAPLFIFYSLLIWFLYYLMFYFILKAFPETSMLGAMAALTIFTIGGIAMAIPLPGGTGSFHFFVATGMVFLFGPVSDYAREMMAADPSLSAENFINKDTAGAFAFIFHGWQTLIVILLGAYTFLTSQKIAKKAKENAELG